LGLVFNMAPGPVFAATLRHGVRGGFRPALAVQIGSLVGDALWAVLGLAGVGLLATLESLRTPMSINERGLYSVEEVAGRLGLHVRTVRAYLRTGRLKGVRIGKQYRISQGDLDTLIGGTARQHAEPVRRHRHVDVSTIVQIDVISPESVDRVTNMLMAAAKTPRSEEQPLRIDTTYDAERARLKIFLSGSMETTVSFLKLVETLTSGEGV
jgi:excisionase family DNA binding protein